MAMCLVSVVWKISVHGLRNLQFKLILAIMQQANCGIVRSPAKVLRAILNAIRENAVPLIVIASHGEDNAERHFFAVRSRRF